MSRRARLLAVVFCLAVVLSACSTTVAQQPAASAAPTVALSPASVPTSAVRPTSEPLFAPGARVGNVDISNLTLAAATEQLRMSLAPLSAPLELHAGSSAITITTSTLKLQLPSADALIAQAQREAAAGRTVAVSLTISFDEDALREQLAALADELPTASAIGVITSSKSISRSFTYTPGQTIDTAQALTAIRATLADPHAARRLTLELVDDTTAPRVGFDLVRANLLKMVQGWDGIVGFYLQDIKTGETVALNEDTVFSGASVMKVPIMLYAYTQVISFTAKQEAALQKMITDSDNYAANTMLAAGAGGFGTEDALVGALAMSDMLSELGLKHTYQHMPYEAADYLIGILKMPIKYGPVREGAAPYTAADRVLRSTPAEMAQIFRWIDQCSTGQGLLLEKFPKTLTAGRCQEMLDRLNKNGDDARMRGGLPKGVRFEHKSGWIDDMQADVGIVRSAGGDYVVALYIYSKTNFTDALSLPIMKAFGRMVYTAYNPVRMK